MPYSAVYQPFFLLHQVQANLDRLVYLGQDQILEVCPMLMCHFQYPECHLLFEMHENNSGFTFSAERAPISALALIKAPVL